MTSSFSELLSFHVTKQINLFPWLPLFWTCLSPKSSLFFRELYRRNAFGPSKNNGTGNPRIGCWHPRRLGDIVPKLDYTNGASISGTEQQRSPFVGSGGRKRMLLSSCNDVAGERKGRKNRKNECRACGPKQRKWPLRALQHVPVGGAWHLWREALIDLGRACGRKWAFLF